MPMNGELCIAISSRLILLSLQIGRAKIADFGIAKLNQTQVTVPGQVMGSPAYMAPEQLSAELVDARSDLFLWE